MNRIREALQIIARIILTREIRNYEEKIASLKNVAKLEPCGTIDLSLMAAILRDKDENAELYLADSDSKIYNKDDVRLFLGLDEVDKIPYVAEQQDCDDYAADGYGDGLGLVWTYKHALNYFIDDNETFWYVERQTNKLSQTLDDWQGWRVRFFLSR